MARKKPEGLEALVRQEPVSIQEITMLDWYAALGQLNHGMVEDKEAFAKECFDQAEAMMKERARRMG